jgi:hypothetical protein
MTNLSRSRAVAGATPFPALLALLSALLLLWAEAALAHAATLGVEIGQRIALAAILVVMNRWRATPSFVRQAYAANVLMMTAGFVLKEYQLAGLILA